MAPKCNLIVDSCCDLPFELLDREGVTLLKFPYLFGSQEFLDDMYLSYPAKYFYDRMRDGGQPSTAQIPLNTFVEAFTAAAESGVPTVFLCLSSGLSGTVGTAQLVRDQVIEQYPGAELYVVDTKLASIAEGLLVYEAIQQREKGLAAAELAAWAEEALYYVNSLFMVDDLESLRRGGRIPDAVANFGSKLDVKPMMSFSLDGRLSLKSLARGRKKGIRQIADFYEDNAIFEGEFTQVITGNADCPKDLDKLHDLVLKKRQTTLFVDGSIGPVIGSHVGPGMIAMVFWGKDRREDLSVTDRIAKRVRGE